MKKLLALYLVCIQLTVLSQQLFNEQVLLKNLKVLSADSMEGRKTGSAGNAKAATFIKSQFKKNGIKPIGNDYEFPFEFSKRDANKVNGKNLIGLIEGKSDSEKYIVISAHHDHEGIKNGAIYNGADDNASGVCALFAFAEYFQSHPPIHNIIFAAFDAEEMGLQGAKAFIKNPPIDLNKVLVNINMDMVSRADNNELIACGTYYYPQLRPILEHVKPTNTVKIIFGHDDPSKFKGQENWTYSSDHGPFHSAKIPFIYFGVADHADYHKPSDDFKKIDPTIYKNCVGLILNSAIAIDAGLK